MLLFSSQIIRALIGRIEQSERQKSQGGIDYLTLEVSYERSAVAGQNGGGVSGNAKSLAPCARALAFEMERIGRKLLE
jgi:hypothetical protein